MSEKKKPSVTDRFAILSSQSTLFILSYVSTMVPSNLEFYNCIREHKCKEVGDNTGCRFKIMLAHDSRMLFIHSNLGFYKV